MLNINKKRKYYFKVSIDEMIDLVKELEDNNIRISLKENNLEINFDGELNTELLIKLKENKEKLIDFLAKHSKSDKVIKPIGVLKDYSISHAQQRLWILSQIEDNSKAYHICNQIELNKHYDIAIFESAVFEVIKRHEILRTVFKLNQQGEIRQQIINVEDFKFNVNHIDFRSTNEPDQKVVQYIKEDNACVFDLENGPLLRVSFLRLSEDRYVIYYNMHHIITDGWSLNVLERDLFSFYKSIKNKVKSDLENLPIQYKDYAAWQLSAIETGLYDKHQDFWMQKLSGDLHRLNLPSYKTRPKIMSNNGRVLTTYLSAELTYKIKQFCTKNNGSLFMGLLSILKILLYKYSSQQDIIIGTVVAGREDSELENQIGFYVNTLTLRNKIDPNDSFLEFFEKLKKSTLESFSHQIYPFDMLVSDLNLPHDGSRNYIFDIMVNLYNFSEVDKELIIDEKLYDEIRDAGDKKINFDLEFIFDETGNALSFTTIYNKDIYDGEVLKKFINHFKQLVESIFEDTDVMIKNYEYLLESEKEEILIKFNDTAIDYHIEDNVVKLFENQVEKTPDAIAVEFDGVKLTYAELNTQANQLRYYLRDKYNLQVEDFVGVKLDRSDKLIIALLGVLKSGMAYVPIDSDYPQERIDYIEKDSNCKAILDAAEFEKFYKEHNTYPKENSEIAFLDINPAYVIYTSGSTGNPKGVVINHSSLTNYILWAKSNYSIGLKSLDFGLFTSLSFDLTVTSLFLPLVTGGLLKVFKTDDVSQILEDYLKSGLSSIKLTPGHIRIFESLDISTTNLELAVVGGEALLQSQVKILRKLNPNIRIINEYGPTESTVGCMVYDVINPEKNILIGKPIANTQLYVLDETLNLSGIGITGELCFSGAGLARGYLNRTDLTEDKFILNPFNPKTRLYKTGDRGRWLPDGNVEYLGRVDDQLKIRGYRIELGELEDNLSRIKGIKQSVVGVKESNEETYLVAYYVSHDVLDKNYIQSELSKYLPDYMIPSYYVQLNNIPLTTNGKVDKKALPNVANQDLIREQYVAPQDDMEIKLVEIWQRILGIDKIGINDNFFSIGGQSIKAIMIVAEIRKQFNVKINLETIFSNPTIKVIALEINNQIWLSTEFTEENITDKIVI